MVVRASWSGPGGPGRALRLGGSAPAPGAAHPEFVRVNDQFCTGGQPRLEHFAQLKADGVKAVINLRTPGEHRAAEEEAAVNDLGMRYSTSRWSSPTPPTSRPRSSSSSPTTRPTGRPSSTARPRSRGRVLDDPPRVARRLHDRGSRKGRRDRGPAPQPAPESVARDYIAKAQPRSSCLAHRKRIRSA